MISRFFLFFFFFNISLTANVEIIKIVDKVKKISLPVSKHSAKHSAKHSYLNLKLYNPNIGEIIYIRFLKSEGLSNTDLFKLDRFFRDFRENKTVKIDRNLYLKLAEIFSFFKNAKYIVINSAYRTENTQLELKKLGYSPARKSLHLKGKAIDFHINGVSNKAVYDYCFSEKIGGIGYYPKLGHIHIDTGRFRVW